MAEPSLSQVSPFLKTAAGRMAPGLLLLAPVPGARRCRPPSTGRCQQLPSGGGYGKPAEHPKAR